MNQSMRRLILEDDVMTLKPDTDIICLIRSDHSYLKGGLSSQWIPLLQSVLVTDPMHPVQYQWNVFFPFRLKVKTNPTCDKITTMTEDEMNDLSSATGRSSGSGIVCELITGVRKLFKFSTFLEDPLGMMFWSEGSISKAMQMRYMDEYYGDKAESIHLSGLYESRLKDFTNAANTSLYREAPIASQHHRRRTNPASLQ